MSTLERQQPRSFNIEDKDAVSVGLQISKKQPLPQIEPYWFNAEAHQTQTSCDEVYIRAGSASNGLKVVLKNFNFNQEQLTPFE